MKTAHIALLAASGLGFLLYSKRKTDGPTPKPAGIYRFRVTYPQTMSLPDAEKKKQALTYIPGIAIVSQDARSIVYDFQTSSEVHFQDTTTAEDGTVTELIAREA